MGRSCYPRLRLPTRSMTTPPAIAATPRIGGSGIVSRVFAVASIRTDVDDLLVPRVADPAIREGDDSDDDENDGGNLHARPPAITKPVTSKRELIRNTPLL